jgi:hypothetical protein
MHHTVGHAYIRASLLLAIYETNKNKECIIHHHYPPTSCEGDFSRRRLERRNWFNIGWFGHVQRRPPEAPVRSAVLKRTDNVKSSRGRPKLTWDESIKRYLKKWNISKDLAMDRSAWRLAINMSEPWPLFVLCPLCPFMCLPVSRLFWVSSLAYPNLLGTKGYVVVV